MSQLLDIGYVGWCSEPKKNVWNALHRSEICTAMVNCIDSVTRNVISLQTCQMNFGMYTHKVGVSECREKRFFGY